MDRIFGSDTRERLRLYGLIEPPPGGGAKPATPPPRVPAASPVTPPAGPKPMAPAAAAASRAPPPPAPKPVQPQRPWSIGLGSFERMRRANNVPATPKSTRSTGSSEFRSPRRATTFNVCLKTFRSTAFASGVARNSPSKRIYDGGELQLGGSQWPQLKFTENCRATPAGSALWSTNS